MDPIRQDAGRLMIESTAASDLAARFGTPLYVTSEAALRANVRALAVGRARCLAPRPHPRAGLAQGQPDHRASPHPERRGRRLRRVRRVRARDRARCRYAGRADLGQRVDQARGADRPSDRGRRPSHRGQRRGAGRRRGRGQAAGAARARAAAAAAGPDRPRDDQRVHRARSAGRGGRRLQARHPDRRRCARRWAGSTSRASTWRASMPTWDGTRRRSSRSACTRSVWARWSASWRAPCRAGHRARSTSAAATRIPVTPPAARCVRRRHTPPAPPSTPPRSRAAWPRG